MANEESNVRTTNPRAAGFPQGPVMYADVILGIAYGGQVCRITLGIENPGRAATPAVTLVLPSAALVDLVHNVKSEIVKPEFASFSKQQLDDMLLKAQDGNK